MCLWDVENVEQFQGKISVYEAPKEWGQIQQRDTRMGRPGTPALGGRAEEMALVEPGEEMALEGLDSSPPRRWAQALHNRVWWDNETQQAPAATGEVHICSAENLFTFQAGTAVEQSVRGACAVSSPGQLPGYPGLTPELTLL